MATTTRWALRYPALDGSDAPDVPLWMSRLALDLDGVAMDDQGLLDGRPAAGKRGRYWYATDTLALYRDNGTAWVQINAPQGYAEVLTQETATPGGAQGIPFDFATVGPSVTVTVPANGLVAVRAEVENTWNAGDMIVYLTEDNARTQQIMVIPVTAPVGRTVPGSNVGVNGSRSPWTSGDTRYQGGSLVFEAPAGVRTYTLRYGATLQAQTLRAANRKLWVRVLA